MDTENVVTKNDNSVNYQKIFRYVAIAIVAVIVLALVISIVGALIPDKFGTPGKNYIFRTQNDDGQYVFIFNGKAVELDEDASENLDYSAYDYNNKYCMVLATADEEKGTSELIIINKKKAVSVSDDVLTAQLSEFGDTFFYVTEENELFKGDLSNPKKAKEIASDVSSIAAVSPDGKSVAYVCKDEKDDEVEYEYYISKNGKKGEKFEEDDSEIFAISNGAKYIYYVKYSEEDGERTYVTNGKNKNKLADGDVEGYFNRDGSQFIYSAKKDGETDTYITSKGGEKQKVKGGDIEDILCPDGAKSGDYFNVASFAKCAIEIYDDDRTNYYLLKNTKGKTEDLDELKNADQMMMLDDAKTVIFIKNGSLRTCDITKPNKAATEYDLGEDVYFFTASPDGEDIYVYDEDATLNYVKSKKKMQKIDEDLSAAPVAIDGGKVYYINEDGDLYYAKKTSNSKKKVLSDVESLDGYSVRYYDDANDIYVYTEDAVYTVSGKKAKKLVNIG